MNRAAVNSYTGTKPGFFLDAHVDQRLLWVRSGHRACCYECQLWAIKRKCATKPGHVR